MDRNAELNEERDTGKPKVLFPIHPKPYIPVGKELYPYVLDRVAAFGCEPMSVPIGDWTPELLAKPGSITPHTEFNGQVYVLTKEEGGRHTAFFKGYRPQFYIRTTDVTGDIELPEGVEMVMPGDNVNIDVKLIAPVALEEKMRFAIREGGRTVGAGTVSKIIK